MITVAGRPIDFVASGQGPTLLFVPGSFSTPGAWRGVQRLLPARYRLVSTSLCGYGGTAETRTAGDSDMQHQIDVVASAARHAEAPVHLIGHSFGAMVALATVLSRSIEVASIALFEANPMAVLRERGQGALYDQTWLTSHDFEAAVQAGEHDAAGRIIDFWGGPGTFAAMPPPVQAYCRETAAANVLDWHTAFGFRAVSADYARLDLPVLLVRGGNANAVMVEITNGLSACLPRVREAVVPGAGHFLISTHARECSALLSDFLAGLG